MDFSVMLTPHEKLVKTVFHIGQQIEDHESRKDLFQEE